MLRFLRRWLSGRGAVPAAADAGAVAGAPGAAAAAGDMQFSATGMPYYKRRFSVGRLPHNDIVIAEPAASRTHFYILLHPDGLAATLIDTGTPAGLEVTRNGVRTVVQGGGSIGVGQDDPIRIGASEFTVRGLVARSSGTDIFVSYAREDEAFAQRLELDLAEHGWRLWRDDRLQLARSFDEEIERQLVAARCVCVVWSARSVASQWVRAEASVALERKVLVPVFMEEVEAPVLFRSIQGCLLTATAERERKAQLATLVAKLEAFIGRPRP